MADHPAALPVFATLPPPDPQLRTVVVVPVRNEAPHMAAAVQALAQQRDVTSADHEVLLLANNCDDGSAAAARAAGLRHPQLVLHVLEAAIPPPHANIGYVRRQLMDAACSRLEATGPGGWIASTDGDTRVAPDWLANTRAEADAGVAAVGGRIEVDGSAALHPRARRLSRIDAAHWLLRSRLESLLDPDAADPWPRHHQHFGASLAVSAQGYRQVGGVPDVEWLEDDALVRAFVRADLPVRHSPRVRVRTSGRLDGRAEVGLSWQLRQWAEAAGSDDSAGDAPVQPPRRYADVLRARRALRAIWRAGGAQSEAQVAAPARLLGFDAGAVAAALQPERPFGAILDALERDHADAHGDDRVPMSQAVAELRTLVRDAAAQPAT